MKTLALSSVSFGASSINGNNGHAQKPAKNEPTVSMPKSKYDELRRNAAKGVMAMTMAAAIMGGGATVTSCSKSDDVQEVTNNDKIDVQTQKTLMNMLGVLGVPVMTNSSNPKIIDKLKMSDFITDYDYPAFPPEAFTYNSDLSDKTKSVYNGDQSDRLEVKSADNGELIVTVITPDNTVTPIHLKNNKDCIDTVSFFNDGGKGVSEYKKSDKGTGWVSYDGSNGVGDFKMQASAK
jgi:hypothetical protein